MSSRRTTAWAVASALVLVVIAASDFPERWHHFLQVAGDREVWPWFLGVAALLTLWLKPDPDRRAPWVLLAVQGILIASYLGTTGGQIPTRDDHPAFLYRMHLLWEHFPDVLFYNPEWNAGYLATEIVSTGALSPFLLGLPVLATGPVEERFALLVPYLFVLVVPWAFFLAARWHGAGAAGAALGGILATAPTTVTFLYTLHYGVYPFVLAAGFAVVAVALFARLFQDRRGGWPTVAVLVGATSLCLFWPLGAVMLAPVLVIAPVVLFRAGRREWLLAAGAAAALLVIHVPWVRALALHGDSLRFAAAQESALLGWKFSWAEVLETVLRFVEELHPVSLVLLVPGLLWARHGALLGILFLWNLLVAVAGDQVKANIALERFAVSAAFFAAVPATLAMDRILRTRPTVLLRSAFVVLLGVLLLGVLTASRFYENQGVYDYRVLPPELERTIRTIRDRCPSEGRVLVPGFSLHWFGGGHIAALPLLAKRSFIGNDYYHRRDYSDVVPETFRSPERIEDFLRLYDVRCVLAWNESWRHTLEAAPVTSPIRRDGAYTLFGVSGRGGRFLEGAGRVRERPGRIVVETDDPEVVLRYRYFEALRTEPPVPIGGFPVADGSEFIRLETKGHGRVTIRW